MRNLISNLYANDDRKDLYLSVIETIEGIFKQHSDDTWRLITLGDSDLLDKIDNDIIGAGLLGLGLEEEAGGIGGGFAGSVLMQDLSISVHFCST